MPDKNRRIGPTIRAAVYARDGNRCLKCGSQRHLTIDHIKPISKGGTKQPENLQTLCSSCNNSKRRDEIDYRLVKEQINIPHVDWSRSRWLYQLDCIDFEMQELNVEINFVQSRIKAWESKLKDLEKRYSRKALYKTKLLTDKIYGK